MWKKADLKEQLAQMGLTCEDAVLIHSSMKAIGEVEGGADTVVDTFMEFLKDGQFMAPTHTWKQMGPEHPVFDPETDPCCVGIIPEIFRKREGVVRSLHPTHSMAVYGKNAREYVKGEENLHTPCDPSGCWGRLREIHAKILLIGVTHARNTYIHSIEESFDIPERLTEEPAAFQMRMPDGSIKDVPMHRHYNRKMAHISEAFDKLADYYCQTGAAKKVKFGDADCILCDAEKLFEKTGDILKKKPDFFIPDEE